MNAYLNAPSRALPVALAHYVANTKPSEEHRWQVIGHHLAAMDEFGRLSFHGELFECRNARRTLLFAQAHA
jgi:hypothetical protein